MLKLKLINSPKPLKIKFSYNFPEVLPVVLEEKTIIPKIVDQIIIPSSNYDGMSQVTVKAVDSTIDKNIKSENIKKDVSILGVQGNVEELKGTKLEITKNGTYIPEEPYNAFTEVDVATTNDPTEWFGNTISAGTSDSSGLNNSIKKIPSNLTITGNSAAYLFSGCKSLTEIPQLDTSNVINMLDMFAGCTKLKSIPTMDTSKVTNMSGIFDKCQALKSIPTMDTSKVTAMSSMFNQCSLIEQIPNIDTSNNTAMNYMFAYCSKLKTIPLLNASKVTTVYGIFSKCEALTNLGGLQNLGQAYSTTSSANNYNYKLSLISGDKLTHDSLMNVINNLYDIATKGVKTQQLVLGSTNIAKLTAEEVAIATNKGWSVS